MTLKEAHDQILVLFRLQRTGRVDKPAAFFQAWESISQDETLDRGKLLESFRFEAPSCVHPSPQDSGIGAGHVEKNTIKSGSPLMRRCTGPVKLRGRSNVNMLSGQIFKES